MSNEIYNKAIKDYKKEMEKGQERYKGCLVTKTVCPKCNEGVIVLFHPMILLEDKWAEEKIILNFEQVCSNKKCNYDHFIDYEVGMVKEQ